MKRSSKREALLFAVGGAVVAVSSFGGWAYAQAQSDELPFFSFVYHGELEVDGQPITGDVDLVFRVYGSAEGSEELTPEPIEVSGVSVSAGRFVVPLPLDQEVLEHPAVWLGVSVDSGDGVVALGGRQRVLSTAYAGISKRAVHADDGNPPGTVIAFAGEVPPPGWLLCDGSAVGRAEYPELFWAIGVRWGEGDGASTFNLPDMRGRAAIGAGLGAGLSERTLGTYLGEENHSLTVSEMPSHTHDLVTVPANSDYPGGYSGGGWAGDPVNQSTTAAGGNQPHNIMQPSVVMNYLIKI